MSRSTLMQSAVQSRAEAAVGYVERNLIPGETILYRTKLHWIAVLWSVVAGAVLEVAGTALLVYQLAARRPVLPPTLGAALAGAMLLAGSLCTAWSLAQRNATEMVVTNKRVLVKTGIATRKTFELLLSRIESIGVVESLWGRMLGYGTVILRGVGGTPDEFDQIARPLEFRSHVQQQIESANAHVSGAAS